jgi:hypothetical protein
MATTIKGLKMVSGNNDEEAAELLELIIRKRKQEIQRETPEVDIADALRSTIMNFIKEGVDVDRLTEPTKRRQRMMHQDSDEEESEEDQTEDVIDVIVNRFLTEQRSRDENTLKIDVVENPQASEGEESPYLMIAELQIGKETHQRKDISIKVLKLKERPEPPQKNDDSQDSYEYSTDDEEEVEPSKESKTVVLTPKESKKIPVLKSEIFQKSPSPKKKEVIDENEEERTKRIGFKYMYFTNIPKNVKNNKHNISIMQIFLYLFFKIVPKLSRERSCI